MKKPIRASHTPRRIGPDTLRAVRGGDGLTTRAETSDLDRSSPLLYNALVNNESV